MVVKLYKQEETNAVIYDVLLTDAMTAKALYELNRLGINRFDRCEIDFATGELIATVSRTINYTEGGEAL